MSEGVTGPLVQLHDECARGEEDFRDRAAAIQVWLREQRAGFDLQNHVAEMKIRAERRLGDSLAEHHPSRGGQPRTVARCNRYPRRPRH